MDNASWQFLELMGAGAMLGLAGWKTGIPELVVDKLSGTLARNISWLVSPDGAWSSLVDQLPYIDFYEDVFVTRNLENNTTWLWAGVELKTIASDGFGGREWELLGNKLHRLYTSLPDDVSVQTIYQLKHQVPGAITALESVGKKASKTKNVLLPLIYAKIDYLKASAEQGSIKTSRLFVLLGKQSTTKQILAPVKATISSKPFQGFEAQEFSELADDITRIRDGFMSGYYDCGGLARKITSKQVFELAYQGLNPARAQQHVAPNYRQASFNKVSNKTVVDDIEMSSLSHNLFAENPRQTLCFTNAKVTDWYIEFDKVLRGCISLQKLPRQIFAGLMERLTRNPEINFDFEVSTGVTIGNFHTWDEKLERMLRNIRISINRSYNPNADEEMQEGEIVAIRQALRNGEKIVSVGLSITFTATNLRELQRKRDLVLRILRSLEELEGAAEPHHPFRLYVASLPGGIHADFRQKTCLSQDVVGLTPFTNAPEGVSLAETIAVYETPSGNLFQWHPRSKDFNSGMSLFCGPPGSGKSATLNDQRANLLLAGHLGASFDFGGSATRLCLAVGGNYVDVTDPRRTKGLCLFAIRPLPGEQYSPEELTEEGLPKDRLAELEKIMEILCIDANSGEKGLAPTKVSVLRRYIRKTYAQLVNSIPIIDNFINALRNAPEADRQIASELAARLEIYAQSSSLGSFLNDGSSTPLPIDVGYTVFDFRGAVDDERLMLIAAMGCSNYLHRFLRNRRSIGKFIDVDEFHVITQYERICDILALMARTARKANAIVSVASQDPGDFDKNEAVRGIRTSCEVLWLFQSIAPDYTSKVFELSVGETKALKKLQTGAEDFRDCLLIYPARGIKRGCAHLRIKFSPLGKRLFAGAGRERATLAEALTDIRTELQPKSDSNFYRALVSDPLGENVGKNRV